MTRIVTVLSLLIAVQGIDHGPHHVGWRFQIERDPTRSYSPAETAAGAYRLSVEDVQAMADDLGFAYQRLITLPNVDASRVAIVGMSNGALGAVGAANRLSAVRAVVSLDGTIGERAAGRVLPMLAGASDPASHPSILHLYTPVNEYLDFSELRKRPGNCFTVKIPTVRHADFLSFALLQPPSASDGTRIRTGDKFKSMARLTRAFIEKSISDPAASSMPELGPLERELGFEVARCR